MLAMQAEEPEFRFPAPTGVKKMGIVICACNSGRKQAGGKRHVACFAKTASSWFSKRENRVESN